MPSGSPNVSFQLPVKRKIFISYHHHGDQRYYDDFWESFSKTYNVVSDNSLDREVDSDDSDYVMRRISESYITGSSCTIVLVGQATWGRKYADWEIKATLDKQHGLIGVQLPTLVAGPNGKVIVPARLNDNIVSGYALWLSWSQVTASIAVCTEYIERANRNDKRLIDNRRERRLRNA